jgi:membrane associated rhomboid family serine protease
VTAVIPLGDLNPTRRRPWFTWALLAANIGIFVFVQPWQAGFCEHVRFIMQWAAIPAELAQGHPLDAAQLARTPAGRCDVGPFPEKSVYAGALYSMFLHSDWLHLGGNMLYLWIFGNNVEDRFGHLRFLVFYLFAGMVATVVFAVPNLDSPVALVGASGAIAGVLGSYFIMFPGAWVTVLVVVFLVRMPAAIVLGLWFVFQLQAVRDPAVSGGGIAYLAHVAGFIAGIVVTLVMGFRPQRRRRRRAPPGWS